MDMLRQLRVSLLYKVGLVLLVVALLQATVGSMSTANASPFGQGVFGADVPFGSVTSLAIDLGGNVSIPLAPSGGVFEGSGSHTVTVTSTDVVGYVLYVHALGSTDLTDGSTLISASTNTTDAPLTTNSWGFNTSGSTTDFIGMTLFGKEIKSASGPYKNGDATTVTYGAKTNITQPASSYDVSIVYTVVAPNQ